MIAVEIPKQEKILLNGENHCDVTNIVASDLKMDFRNPALFFKTFEYEPVVEFELPLIKSWTLNANYKFDFMVILQQEGAVQLKVSDVKFKGIVNLKKSND